MREEQNSTFKEKEIDINEMTSPFTASQSKAEFRENNSKYFCSKQNPNHTVTLKTKAKTLVATLKRLTNMNKIAYNRIRIESTWN